MKNINNKAFRRCKAKVEVVLNDVDTPLSRPRSPFRLPTSKSSKLPRHRILFRPPSARRQRLTRRIKILVSTPSESGIVESTSPWGGPWGAIYIFSRPPPPSRLPKTRIQTSADFREIFLFQEQRLSGCFSAASVHVTLEPLRQAIWNFFRKYLPFLTAEIDRDKRSSSLYRDCERGAGWMRKYPSMVIKLTNLMNKP